MNEVHLIGVLALPIELRREGVSGSIVGRAVLAVPRGIEGMDFIPMILRGREAAEAAKYLGEGSRVEVHGHLHSALLTERNTDGTDCPRRTLEMIADRITYLTVCPPRGEEG